MAKITKSQMKYSLEGVKVVISMLEAANGADGRFTELIKKIKIAEEFLEAESARKPRKSTLKIENTPENIREEPEPVKPKDLIEQPKYGGKVSPARTVEVGMVSGDKRGGKVTPAK